MVIIGTLATLSWSFKLEICGATQLKIWSACLLYFILPLSLNVIAFKNSLLDFRICQFVFSMTLLFAVSIHVLLT
eukprot:Pgem_evm1s12067